MRHKGVANQEQALAWDAENRLAAVTYTNRTPVGGGSGQLPVTCNGAPCKRVFLPLVMYQPPAERYSYDADGVRVRKETKTEVTRYIGPHFEVTVAITNGQTLTTTKYYDFGGQRIAVRQITPQSNTLSYLHGDHLGSTSVATSNTGASTNSVRYYAYGGQRSGNLFALPTDHTFTGQKLDRGTGLLYYGARYYDSGLGMFISPDAIVPEPGNPQSLNRYAYVRNNPLRYTDPTGHCVFAPPFDTLVCVGFLAVTLLSAGSGPPPPSYPKNYYSAIPCTDALPECFGDVVRLKDFNSNGPDNPIPRKEFEAFAAKVAEDLYSHDVDWPGLAGGRGVYDTPFYNGGQSERRTGDSDAQKGVFPANQSVCIAGIGCAGRSEINYIAQGMWGARTGESKPISKAIVWTWKLWEYQEKPSDETLFWLQYGYDYYMRWQEQQQANAPTP